MPAECFSVQSGHHLAHLHEKETMETVTITFIIICVFIASKNAFDNLRRKWARITVVVIGGGPIGLISVLIAAKSERVSRIILYDDKNRQDLLNRPQQIAVERHNVQYLTELGVDFDNLEGCWQQHCFYTRIGVFQEYVLSILYRLPVQVDVKLNSKVCQSNYQY